MEECRRKGFLTDEGKKKNQLLQIFLVIELATLKFNVILTFVFSEIQSNGELRFDECRIGPCIESWDGRCERG